MNTAIRKRLEAQLRRLESLPALPVTLGPLRESLDRPAEEIEVDRVVQLVSYDKSIAAQLMRMTNSPLFGRKQMVGTVREAVLALGFWRVRDVVFSCQFPKIMSGWTKSVDHVSFWRHSLGCALVSQKLARLLRSRSAEKAYLAGLLHDLGILVNATLFSDQFASTLQRAKEQQTPLHEVEKEVLGLTHAESGRILAEVWNLPEDVATVMEFHHDVGAAPTAKDLVALVHLSDLLCRLREMGYGYYEALSVDFAGSPAWGVLAQHCPHLDRFDLTRFTFELDEYAEEVLTMVSNILGSNTNAA